MSEIFLSQSRLSDQNYLKQHIIATWGDDTLLEKGKMYLGLYHGRKSIDEELKDWGSEGPVWEIESFHSVYLSTFHIFIKGADDIKELTIHNEFIYFDGIYYGDFQIFTKE